MEEIVTVDGQQYKLSYDVPLTAEQKAQTITDIRRQSGCSSCGGRATNRSMQNLNNPSTGTVTCPTGKGSGSSVSLHAAPSGGVAPYTVAFWYSTDGTTDAYNGTTGKGMAAVGIVETGVTEAIGGGPGTGVTHSFTITDLDVAASTGNTNAAAPTDVDVGTGFPDFTGATYKPVLAGGTGSASLDAGSLRVYSCAVDSCSGGLAPGTCVEWCDIALVCAAPTCNFVVT